MSDKVDYGPILADLERRRAELDQAIATLRRLAGTAENGGPVETATPSGVGGGLRDDAFFGMKGPDAVKAYLAWAKRPQSAAKIADELVAHGFTTSANSPADFIRTTLRRLREAEEVVQVKKDWALASWYPGLRRRPKQDEDDGETEDQENTDGEGVVT